MQRRGDCTQLMWEPVIGKCVLISLDLIKALAIRKIFGSSCVSSLSLSISPQIGWIEVTTIGFKFSYMQVAEISASDSSFV